MQRLGGLLLMLAGLSLGAYTFLPPQSDSEETLRQVTRISAAPDRFAVSDADALARTSGPAQSATAQASPAEAASIETAALASAPSSTWSAIVTSEPATTGRITSAKPGDDEARAQLTRDLQTELKRVGCYSGDVTGAWSPSTRRAMSTFMDRVNATLPIDEPDYILLTLVQGHTAQACGTACPSGQSTAEDGRCVPQAVLAARAAKKAKSAQEMRIAEDEQRRVDDERAAELQRKADEQRLAQARKIEEQRVVEQQRKAATEQARVAEARRLAEQRRLQEQADQKRLAVAAAKLAAAKVAAAQPVVPPAPRPAVKPAPDDEPRIVAEAGQERLPWLDDDLSKPAAAAAKRLARPDGMMSIGGPDRVARADLAEPNVTPAATSRAMPAPPAVTIESDDDIAARSSAAPVLRTPAAAVRAVKALPQQGAAGTKSGPAVQRGLPGTKSGIAVPPSNRTARKFTAQRNYAASKSAKHRTYAARRPSPVYAPKPSKQKFFFYASSAAKSRRGQPRPGSPAYNMLQAMGGIY